MPNASEVAENIVKRKVAAREVENLAKSKKAKKNANKIDAVSYTHLTLPTNREV